MKFEIEISEDDLKQLLLEKISDKITNDLVGWGVEAEKNKKKILDKINWSNTSKTLQEIIIKKFFENGILK